MNAEQLAQIMPRCPDDWARALLEIMPRWDIRTPAREAAFLAQFAVETREFTVVEENLSYSIAAMMHTWPHRFKTPDSAAPYEHKPEKLANYVYADRNGNGPEVTGDGWMFRGRGPQLTGRANYHAAGLALGLPLEDEPERVCRSSVGADVAGWYWYSHACNDFADKGDFETITRKINGGLTGQDQRLVYFAKAKQVLGL